MEKHLSGLTAVTSAWKNSPYPHVTVACGIIHGRSSIGFDTIQIRGQALVPPPQLLIIVDKKSTASYRIIERLTTTYKVFNDAVSSGEIIAVCCSYFVYHQDNRGIPFVTAQRFTLPLVLIHGNRILSRHVHPHSQ